MEYRKIDEDNFGFTPDEVIIPKEKLLQDLDRHQGNLQELETHYQDEKSKLEKRIIDTQILIDLLEK